MAAPGTLAFAAQDADREQDVFFRALFHDDRNSYYVLSSDENGTWTDTPVKRSQLPFQHFDDSSNYYITHNGFATCRRKLDNCRQINALFFDLDCHSAAAFECRRLVAEAQRLIAVAVEQGRLPQPTLMIDSGRGLHLYYVLERSIPYRQKVGAELKVNDKSLAYFHDVQLRLADTFDEVLDMLDGLDVDRSVFDHSRVSRLPGTYNTRAGRYARLVGAIGPYWHLSDLACYKPARGSASASREQTGAAGKVIRLNRLMMARIRKIAELQEYRSYNCEGSRELMCFVYYNTAVQIYDRTEAASRLAAFNARFTQPLPYSELDSLRHAVDSVVNVRGERGYYILNAETLIHLLGLTRQEMEELNFFASKRVVERAEAKKLTKEKRQRRDHQICVLYSTGDMTQQEVANTVGCSLRTVATVLKKAGLTRSRTTSEENSRKSAGIKEIRQRNLKMMRQLIDSKAACSLSPQCANPWQPCLGSSGYGYPLRTAARSLRQGFSISTDNTRPQTCSGCPRSKVPCTLSSKKGPALPAGQCSAVPILLSARSGE